MSEKLSPLIQSMVLSHIVRRFLLNFAFSERTKQLEVVLKRVTRLLKKREKSNFRDFVFAEKFEKVLWQNATEQYHKETPILGVDFVVSLYFYYPAILNRYAGLSEKNMLDFAASVDSSHIGSNEYRELESNDDDLLSTFVKLYEPYSGVGLKKSAFAGKLLTIKNNLIIEGKSVKDGF